MATTKNNQTSPADIQSKSNEDVWSFDSGDDVIEISLSECVQGQDVKK